MNNFVGNPDVLDALNESLDEVGTGSVIVDSHSKKILSANKAFCEIFEYSKDELYALSSYFDLAPPSDREEFKTRSAMRASNLPTKDHHFAKGLTKSGRLVDIEIGTKKVFGTESLAVLIIVPSKRKVRVVETDEDHNA